MRCICPRLAPAGSSTPKMVCEFDSRGRGYGLRSPDWYKLSATFTFATDQDEYQWLTHTLAVMEGELDEKTGRALWQVFVPAE